MTDRDRLIEMLIEAEAMCDNTLDCEDCKYEHSGKCKNELTADHLLANGVIVPPCKVGDKVYMLVTRKTHSVEFEKGKRMLRVDNQHTFIKQTHLTKLNFFKVLDDFGKTIFLTKEEAEQALKDRGKEDEGK